MHIGFLTCELKPTHGWARYSLDLLMALHRSGVRVTALASASTPTDFPFPVHPILPELVPAPRYLPARLGLRIPAARVALRGAELVHTVVEPFSHLGAVAAGSRPHVMSACGTYAALPRLASRLSRPVYARTFRRADGIVCISEYTQRVLLDVTPSARSVFIPCGVDGATFAQRVEAAQPFEKSGPTVLFVGAVKARKGVIELVNAFTEVQRTRPDAHCVIVGSLTGDPSYAARLRAEITHLGLDSHVTLTGRVSDDGLMRWYKTADVFALPAMNDGPRFEGFGLVYLEANAARLPAIGTRDCGAESAIVDGETGFLVSQSAVVPELSAAILRLLNDDALRAEMGQKAHAYALSETWDKAAAAYIALYEDILRAVRR
ncbi:MAG: glycosyltransferase family 4 protein [Anaerolineae bacterium]|jgi:glycosyltransferase involved in cell wall biosynthesis|nr:glycosyltransferase family 4 protein [Anaerolineae bacterium]